MHTFWRLFIGARLPWFSSFAASRPDDPGASGARAGVGAAATKLCNTAAFATLG